MKDKIPMFASKSPAYTTSKRHNLPELNSSRSQCNRLPILKVNQSDDDDILKTALPSMLKSTTLKGDSTPCGLEKCLTISVLDSNVQKDIQEIRSERRDRSKLCSGDISYYDWLVKPHEKDGTPLTRPQELQPPALPYDGLVLKGHGLCHTTKQKDDISTTATLTPIISSAKITQKDHHVTFDKLPALHRRHPPEGTNPFRITGFSSMKEKKLPHQLQKFCSGTTDHQNRAHLKLPFSKQQQLPKTGKATHLKAVPLLGGRRIIYDKPPTVCNEGVPLPTLAPVVKSLNKKSRRLTNSPSIPHGVDTEKEESFLPKLDCKTFNMVSHSQGYTQPQGEASNQKRESISPPFTAGLFQPRPQQQTQRANSTLRRFHSRGVGPDKSIRAKGRHE